MGRPRTTTYAAVRHSGTTLCEKNRLQNPSSAMQPDEAAAASPGRGCRAMSSGAFGGRERVAAKWRPLVPLGGPFRDIVPRNDARVAGAD